MYRKELLSVMLYKEMQIEFGWGPRSIRRGDYVDAIDAVPVFNVLNHLYLSTRDRDDLMIAVLRDRIRREFPDEFDAEKDV